MTENQLAEELAKLLSDILEEEVDPTNLDASLMEDYSADSMDAVEIADRIEMKFDVEVSNEEVVKIKTFGDALRHVQERR